MAPQPRLKEIWCPEIFEVPDEVHKRWNIIPMGARQRYTNAEDSSSVNSEQVAFRLWVHKNPQGAFPCMRLMS